MKMQYKARILLSYH